MSAGPWVLRAGGVCALALLSACSSAPPPATASAAPGAEAAAAAVATARGDATDHFYRGKALALAGEPACARQEFQQALDTFRSVARPGESDDLAFAEDLYQSVDLYDRRAAGSQRAEEERPPAEYPHDSLVAQPPSAHPEEIAAAAKEVREVAESSPAAPFDIPVVLTEKVLKAVAFYQFRTPLAFAGALQRSGRYLPMMRQILKDAGLPQDLVYVAMVESAFKSSAHSRRAAHGYWQFIDGTARRYGLKKTREIDERSDPFKSTKAAAAYFRDLYEMFGDWSLAMAAYDTGEGRVLRALQATGAKDYWELSAGNALHRETRDYVPFIMAAALISRDPAKFGFEVVPDPPMEFETVELDRRVDLAQIARATGTNVVDIQALNGELRLRTTPRGRYELRIPPGTTDAVRAALPGLPEAREVADRRVTVKKGDTLARIAQRYRVSVADLCDWNDLSRSAKPKRGSVLVIPGPGPSPRRIADASPAGARPAARGEVRAIPTPSAAIRSAAEIGNVSQIPAAAAASPLPQTVEIPAEGFVSDPAPQVATAAPKRAAALPATGRTEDQKIVYTVRRGDTLFHIAREYGTTVDAIRRTNRLGRREVLAAGRRLTLVVASSR